MRAQLFAIVCFYVFGFPLHLQGQDYFENSHESYLIWPPSDTLVKGPTDNIDPNRNIPECSIPEGIQISYHKKDQAQISWRDIAAKEDGTRYQIRYKASRGWKKQFVFKGNKININLNEPFDSYQFEIRKLCGGFGKKFDMSSIWTPITNEYLKSPIHCDSLNALETAINPNENLLAFTFTPTQQAYFISHNICLGVLITYCDDTIPQFKSYCPSPDNPTITCDWRIPPVWSEICDISYISVINSTNPNSTPPTNETWDNISNTGADEFGQIWVSAGCPPTSVYTANGPGGQSHSCPEEYNIPAATGDVQLEQASIGEVFIIYGLPILLTEVTKNSDGTFSGSGSVLLPFQGKSLDVTFEDIGVNSARVVYSGKVTGIPGNPDDYPDLTNSAHEEIEYCVELPDPGQGTFDENGINSVTGLPWSPNGFGPGGTYDQVPPYPGYKEGDPVDQNYDPNGFNADGIHKETGTNYNPNGCDQNSLNQAGQPCDPAGDCPYYWMTSCADVSEAGSAFADSISAELSGLISLLLNMLKDENLDSMGTKSNLCADLRADMETLVQDLKFDRRFVFGEDDKYFKKQMFKHFAEKPKIFETYTPDRNAEVVLLEKKHVQLFNCDEKYHVFIALNEIISDHLSADKLLELKNTLLHLIKRLNKTAINSFNTDQNAFNNWLKINLKIILSVAYNASAGQDIGFNPPVYKKAINHLQTPSKSFENWIQSENIASSGPGTYSSNRANLLMYQEFIAKEINAGKRYINNIHKAFYLEGAIVNRKKRYRTMLSGEESENALPLIISKEVLGIVYSIIIDNVILRPSGAFLDAFLILEDPNSGRKIVFEGLNIPFSPGGLSNDESVLRVINDVDMKLGNNMLLTLKGTNGNTYVSWDCGGFNGIGVEAEIEFCRNMLIPLNPTTMSPIEDEDVRVHAYFNATMPAWGAFMAEITMDPFAVAGAEQIGWRVTNAQIDFNDLDSYDFTVPALYQSPHIDGNRNPLSSWKGFHLEEISATLPRQIKNNGDGESVTVGAQNVIIDERGFTGQLFVGGGILPLDQGNADGWAFSIDTFKVDVVQNHLIGGGMSGLINVPIMKSKTNQSDALQPADCLAYRAYLQSENVFSFDVKVQNDFCVPLWKADLTLREESKIEMELKNDEFTMVATLHGSISIDAALTPSIGVYIDKIDFEEVQISNLDPYFSPGLWSMPESVGANFGGFNLVVQNIGLFKDTIENSVSLNISSKIKLTGEENSFGVDGAFRLTGVLEKHESRQSWKFNDFHVDGLKIDATIKGTRIQGGLIFFGKDNPDPTFGSGFRGILGVRFAKLDVAMAAVAQFGHKDDFKYFMVDAMASKKPGIPFGAFQLHGFGGGLYRHMRKDNAQPYFFHNDPGQLPNISAVDLGASISGTIYKPDRTIGLGLKAIVLISTKNEKIFNANAKFEIAFNSSDSGGGINKIQLQGNAQLMYGINRQGNTDYRPGQRPETNALMAANVDLTFDFENHLFDGNLEVYLNAGPLTGADTDGRMVNAVIHFSKKEWYINIGEPSHRAGIKLLDLVVDAYMCVGTNVPEMPPLPSNVSELTRHFTKQNQLRNTGRGFAFGASLNFNTGEKEFLIFYGQFELTLGFDVLIKDYGPTARCQGSAENEQVGINGWYAAGQIYAYVGGKVGIKAFGNKYEILDFAIAAVLEARLPNPMWAAGTVAGRYRILGGLIKGDCRFHFEIGERCIIVGTENPEEEQEIILTLSPFDQNEGITSTVVPEVSFTIPIDKEFTVQNLNSSGSSEYVAKLDKLELSHNGRSIDGEIEWAEGASGKVLARFIPTEFVPGNDSIQIMAKVKLYSNGNPIKTESRVNTFYTAPRPSIIPEDNVRATYPVRGMNNFYKEEWSEQKGYIALHTGQTYLFTGDSQPEVRLYISDDQYHVLDYEYAPFEKEIIFNLPSSLLENNFVYRLKIVGTENGGSHSGISASANNLPGYGVETSSYPTISAKSGTTETIIFDLPFGVSQFNRFSQKLDYIADHIIENTNQGAGQKKHDISMDEVFDQIEISGDFVDALVNVKYLANENIFLNARHREIHDHLPNSSYPSVKLNNSIHDLKGQVARRAFKMSSSKIDNLARDISPGPRETSPNGSIAFSSNLGFKVDQAYTDLETQFRVVFFVETGLGSSAPTAPDWAKKFLHYTQGDHLDLEDFKVGIQYRLPEKSIVTTSYTLDL